MYCPYTVLRPRVVGAFHELPVQAGCRCDEVSPPGSVLPHALPAGLGNGVLAVGAGLQGSRRVRVELVEIGRHLVIGVEGLFVCDRLAGVSCHAAHDGDEAGLNAPLDFVIGFVIADGVHATSLSSRRWLLKMRLRAGAWPFSEMMARPFVPCA